MCCVPALFAVIDTVHKKFTKILSCKRQKSSQLVIERVNFWHFPLATYWGAIENWMTVRMGYDSATTSPMESNRDNAAVRFRGRHRKTTFGKNGKQSANFSRNSSVLHPWFLLFVRKSFDGQDCNFSQISFCGSAKRPPHRLRHFY